MMKRIEKQGRVFYSGLSRVYHTNLKIAGTVSILESSDPTSLFVDFDDEETREVSVHFLNKLSLVETEED